MNAPAAIADPASPESFDLDALFGPVFSARRAAVVAVSGGSDSLALLHLLHAFLERSPGLALTAVTVDHGLRAESAGEARRVAQIAAALGSPHRTLRWEGEKPRTGVIAAAREARYGLLAAAAQGVGADVILTGHTADDQAETVSMRMARGEGRGLAGMAPFTLFEGRTWILRPLLGLRREALRRHLSSVGSAWVDDPTNADPRFERARLRLGAAADMDGMLRLARDAAFSRAALAEGAATLVRAHADCPLPGLLRLAPAFLEAPGRPAALLALRFLLATAGGRVHPVDESRAAGLLAALETPGRRTLGGAVAERRPDAITLRREVRGVADPLAEAGIADVPVVAPFKTFLPGFDLPLAEALHALVGAEPLPSPPYRAPVPDPDRPPAAASAWQGPARCLC